MTDMTPKGPRNPPKNVERGAILVDIAAQNVKNLAPKSLETLENLLSDDPNGQKLRLMSDLNALKRHFCVTCGSYGHDNRHCPVLF